MNLESNQSNSNVEEARKLFEASAQEFLNSFSTIPYEDLTDGQKELADKIKEYLDSQHPNRTLH